MSRAVATLVILLSYGNLFASGVAGPSVVASLLKLSRLRSQPPAAQTAESATAVSPHAAAAFAPGVQRPVVFAAPTPVALVSRVANAASPPAGVTRQVDLSSAGLSSARSALRTSAARGSSPAKPVADVAKSSVFVTMPSSKDDSRATPSTLAQPVPARLPVSDVAHATPVAPQAVASVDVAPHAAAPHQVGGSSALARLSAATSSLSRPLEQHTSASTMAAGGEQRPALSSALDLRRLLGDFAQRAQMEAATARVAAASAEAFADSSARAERARKETEDSSLNRVQQEAQQLKATLESMAATASADEDAGAAEEDSDEAEAPQSALKSSALQVGLTGSSAQPGRLSGVLARLASTARKNKFGGQSAAAEQTPVYSSVARVAQRASGAKVVQTADVPTYSAAVRVARGPRTSLLAQVSRAAAKVREAKAAEASTQESPMHSTSIPLGASGQTLPTSPMQLEHGRGQSGDEHISLTQSRLAELVAAKDHIRALEEDRSRLAHEKSLADAKLEQMSMEKAQEDQKLQELQEAVKKQEQLLSQRRGEAGAEAREAVLRERAGLWSRVAEEEERLGRLQADLAAAAARAQRADEARAESERSARALGERLSQSLSYTALLEYQLARKAPEPAAKQQDASALAGEESRGAVAVRNLGNLLATRGWTSGELEEKFDADGGGLQLRELARALETITGQEAPVEAVQDVFAALDADGDRELSVRELARIASPEMV